MYSCFRCIPSTPDITLVSNLRMSQKVSHELDVGLSPDDMAVS